MNTVIALHYLMILCETFHDLLCHYEDCFLNSLNFLWQPHTSVSYERSTLWLHCSMLRFVSIIVIVTQWKTSSLALLFIIRFWTGRSWFEQIRYTFWLYTAAHAISTTFTWWMNLMQIYIWLNLETHRSVLTIIKVNINKYLVLLRPQYKELINFVIIVLFFIALIN